MRKISQVEDQLKSLANKLKPTKNDVSIYNSAINVVSKVIDNNHIHLDQRRKKILRLTYLVLGYR